MVVPKHTWLGGTVERLSHENPQARSLIWNSLPEVTYHLRYC
jgi:hypothetical protein